MSFHDRPTSLRHRLRRWLYAAAALALLVAGLRGREQPRVATTFASRIAQLSEPGGFFDTDNLISNEKSYLHVMPALRQAGVTGGAYLGVGPDQNFSYIARIRPAIAFIVDVRRDNLLLHLLFKALFAESGTRVEYLSMLFGRAPPAHTAEWTGAPVARLATYIDGLPPLPSTAALDARIETRIASFDVPLSHEDMATIRRFHHRFIDAGLRLKFESAGRPPRSYYPTYGDLLLETDRQGHQSNYLAAEDDYAFVRDLEHRDLLIPVVGNLGGTTALTAIARMMRERGDHLSAFYTSNVEFYLFEEGTFPRFVENLARLPRAKHAVVIRSVFGGFAPVDTVPGYYSASLVQPVDDLVSGFASGRYRFYSSLTSAR
jgi:hypothetical protein